MTTSNVEPIFLVDRVHRCYTSHPTASTNTLTTTRTPQLYATEHNRNLSRCIEHTACGMRFLQHSCCSSLLVLSSNADNHHSQSRAPTASQIQNPPPPTSSTKANRLFGRGNIGESCASWTSYKLTGSGHTFRKSAAGAFGPDLAKKLSQLVKMEKNVMRSMELVGRERMEVAQQLSLWGEG